jgi:1-acyl-sn-glycerol-3-phosphate acyltransferase
MGKLRIALRLVALAAATGIAYVVVLLLHVRAQIVSVHTDRRPAVCRVWARCVARIVGLRIHSVGPLPVAPCVVVANHLSYLDIVVLGASVPAVFVAKSDMAAWPFLGRPARAAGTLFIDRTNRFLLPSALAAITRVLDRGGNVVVFPEGTSSDGRRVLPFKSSPFEPAAAGGHRVYYAALLYETGPGMPHPEQAVCWWGDMTLLGHLCGLLALPRVTARIQFGVDPGGEPGRRAMANRLHRSVSDAHAELRTRCPIRDRDRTTRDDGASPLTTPPDRQPEAFAQGSS